MNKTNSIKTLDLLGFDFGMKSIGIAYGQTLTKTTRPLTAVKAHNGTPRWEQIEKLIKTWQPDALIVGIPLNMDGTQQSITDAAKQFADKLHKYFKLPVHQADERLTTIAAKEELFSDKGYKALTKANIDAKSAQLILENWMHDFQ
jgi:putative holliday junction resolvase